MKRTPLLIGGLAVAVMAGGLSVWIAARPTAGPAVGPGAVSMTSPSGTRFTRAASHTPAPMPFPVTVSVAGLDPAPVGVTMLIRVAAAVPGVRRLSLYDGARLVGTATPVAGSDAATFSVPPDDPGVHAFVGQAGADTRRSSSAPTAVTEYTPPGATSTLRVPSVAGETQAQAAARLGAPWIGVTLPGGAALDPRSGALLPTGTLLTVPVPATPRSPLQSGVSTLGGGLTGPAGSSTSSGPTGTTPQPTVQPSAGWADPYGTVADAGPTLTATLADCTVTLTTTAADRVGVLQAAATDGGFVLSGEVESSAPLMISNLPAGEWLFEGQDGSGTSAPTAVQVPDRCDPSWQGTVSIRHGLLVLPQPAADVYLYAGVDDQKFVRIPAVDGEFLHAPTTSTLLADQLPQLRGQRLVLQAWRQNGTTATLIGRGELDLPAGWSMDDAVGLAATLRLDPASGPSADDSMDAHWGKPVTLVAHTDSAATGRLRYQVLAEPLTPANHDLDPYGLLASGDAGPVSGSGVDVFSVDLSKLPAPKAGAGRTHVFVRVLAFTAVGGALPLASRVLVVNLPKVTPPPPGTPINAPVVLAVGVSWPHVPNPKLANCIRVTHVPWKGTLTSVGTTTAQAQAFLLSHVYPTAGRYCVTVTQTSDDSGGCDIWGICALIELGEDAVDAVVNLVTALVDGAAKVWDWIAAAYNGVIDFVESAMAEFNPFCLAAKAASSSLGDDCEHVAKIVSTAVVTAVLESYGLPAQLPTSADIADIAKGDVQELVVQYLQSLGVPCDKLKADGDTVAAADGLADQLDPGASHHFGKSLDVCGDLAGVLVGSMKEKIVDQEQANVAGTFGLPYFPLPGLRLEPEPAAQLQPLTVTVKTVGGHPGTAYSCPFRVDFPDPNKQTKPLYRNTSGAISGHDPRSATAVADQLTWRTSPPSRRTSACPSGSCCISTTIVWPTRRPG